MGKDSLLNKRWKNWIFTCKRMKLGPYLTPLTKSNSKWIMNLKISNCKTLIRKQRGKLLNTGLENDCLDKTSKAQVTKPKINKWD